MYFMIKNPSVAPVEGFTILGVSTARNKSDKIGQFGSGLKHGINVLIRAGLTPSIFLDGNELKFYCKPAFMGDKQYNQVFYKFLGESHKTGFSLEFGELDWQSVEMALREIISNAIDSDGVDNITLDIVDDIQDISGTCIYIPLTNEIQNYYNQISDKFLHFTGKQNEQILDNHLQQQSKIYRKGVFVRQIEKQMHKSLFHYNFGDDTKIDETRNMTDSDCIKYATESLSNDFEALKKYFRTLVSDTKYWEDNFYVWRFSNTYIFKAWEEVYGNSVACCKNDQFSGKFAEKRGRKVVYIRNYSLIADFGCIPLAHDYISKVESNGYNIIPANKITINCLDDIWNKLENIGLTKGKKKPEVFNFSAVADNSGIMMGYYENGIIYINLDMQGSYQTILEECAHYITGSSDGERIFQEFAFNVACRMVPEWNQ